MGVESALLLGLLGSLHCVGMCGPLAIAIASKGIAPGRLVYNAGRILTYMLLGLVFGLAGGAARLAGMQQGLSIAAGIFILLWAVLPFLRNRFESSRIVTALSSSVGKLITPLLRRNALLSQFGVGVLNGLLPCGFVYVALAAALAQPSIPASVGFMGVFGLGTFPAMFLVTFAPALFGRSSRTSLRRLVPVGTALVALLLILRGLSLGVPYLSPKLPLSPSQNDSVPACHKMMAMDTESQNSLTRK